LLSICEGEKVQLIFFEVLTIFIFFFFPFFTLTRVFLQKIVSLSYKHFIFTLTITCHLFSQILDHFLLVFSLWIKVSLSLSKFVKCFAYILITNFFVRRKFIKDNTFAKSCVDTIIKYTRESLYSDAILKVGFFYILIGHSAIFLCAILGIRIRHIDKLNFSALSGSSSFINWDVALSLFLLGVNRLRSCHRKNIAWIQR